MREKLIEILEKAGKMRQFPGSLANILIENGVTIQKWIPVTERLPKKHNDGSEVLTFDQNNNTFDVWEVEVVQASPHWFTHWMPLPEPPKEVE